MREKIQEKIDKHLFLCYYDKRTYVEALHLVKSEGHILFTRKEFIDIWKI